MSDADTQTTAINVLGTPLAVCGTDPVTGFFRDGCCHTNAQDVGMHTVCAEVTRAFLEYSRSRGNDLMTPRPEFGFQGLQPGDRWCLCADRWFEAWQAGKAPAVVLAATHQRTLQKIPFEALNGCAVDPA
jgi:uncharacterized protein (DUF2237 family)